MKDKDTKKKELIFSASRKDFRVDTFRAGGKGGQHQNKTDSGVRITHIESGLSAECREGKSQHQNKATAFRRLVRLLVDRYAPKWKRERFGNLKTIRTYHEADNRVVDHASGLRLPYTVAMDKNGFDQMIAARRLAVLMGKELNVETDE